MWLNGNSAIILLVRQKKYFEFSASGKKFQIMTAPGKKMLTFSKLKQEGRTVFGNHIYMDLIPR